MTPRRSAAARPTSRCPTDAPCSSCCAATRSRGSGRKRSSRRATRCWPSSKAECEVALRRELIGDGEPVGGARSAAESRSGNQRPDRLAQAPSGRPAVGCQRASAQPRHLGTRPLWHRRSARLAADGSPADRDRGLADRRGPADRRHALARDLPATRRILLSGWPRRSTPIGEAVDLGAEPGGQLQAALFLPVAVTARPCSGWSVGATARPRRRSRATSSRGSPDAASLPRACTSRRRRPSSSSRPGPRNPHTSPDGSPPWPQQYGPTSGLDPAAAARQPAIRRSHARQADGRQMVEVDIVRSQQVETMILGFIPTASQETRRRRACRDNHRSR